MFSNLHLRFNPYISQQCSFVNLIRIKHRTVKILLYNKKNVLLAEKFITPK